VHGQIEHGSVATRATHGTSAGFKVTDRPSTKTKPPGPWAWPAGVFRRRGI